MVLQIVILFLNLDNKKNMKQNSIDWLMNELPNKNRKMSIEDTVKKAKEMHQEEMSLLSENYHNYLQDNKKGVSGAIVSMSAEQYFNETFNK